MRIYKHNSHLTTISKLMQTDPVDCVAWIEELLSEIRGEEPDEATFEKLGDNMYPEQVSLLSQQLIEHYSKESEIDRNQIIGLIYNLKITSND